MDLFVIDLNEENEQKAHAILKLVIEQARNGVTEFSYKGTLGNVLLSLDLRPLGDGNG